MTELLREGIAHAEGPTLVAKDATRMGHPDLRLRSRRALCHRAVDGIDLPSYAGRRRSSFTPEREAQLSQIASHAGTDSERLVDCHKEFVGASVGEFPDGLASLSW
jgi:hypothetical protein